MVGPKNFHPGSLEIIRELLLLEKFPKKSKILEIGCGYGETACFLKNQGYEVWAIDNNQEIILKNLPSEIHFEWMSGEDLIYLDESFDMIVTECSLFVMKELKKVLKESYRVLKPNGHLLISEPYFKTGETYTLYWWERTFRACGFQKNYKKDVSELWNDYLKETLWKGENLSELCSRWGNPMKITLKNSGYFAGIYIKI